MKTKSGKHRLTQKSVNILYKNLKNKENEKDIENAWREFFSQYYNSGSDHILKVISPYDVDGYLEVDDGLFFFLRILMEFKDGTNLNKISDRVRITAQCIHYLKRFKDNGDQLPNVIIGADENQIFVLYAPNFYSYLDKDYRWDIAPSSAFKEDLELTHDLLNDKNLSIWVYNLSNVKNSERKSTLQSVFDEIDQLTSSRGQEYQVKVTEANIAGLFSEFSRIGFLKPDEIKTRTAVNIFMQTMVGNNEEYYLKPTNSNQLHTDDGYVDVNGAAIQAFFKHFDRNIKLSDRDKMFAMADRLIEDSDRRHKGDFWTSTIWANRADEMLKSVVGSNYKDEAIIWDCASGSKNLTRDFYYANLYSSTLFSSELHLGSKYNKEGISFQYDFLNDDVEKTPTEFPNADDWKIPNSLFNELINNKNSDKPIIFYTNPPYGTSGNLQKDGSSKIKMANSKVNDYMKKNSFGKATQQLYAQFYARILKMVDDFQLKNVYIAFFNNSRNYCGGDYWEKFNNKLFSKFTLEKGNMFNAGEFSDTSDTWPITFSVFKLRSKKNIDLSNLEFHLSVEKSEIKDGITQINKLQNKTLRPIYADRALSEWMKEPLKNGKYVNLDMGTFPELSSAMGESKRNKPQGKLYKGSLGYIMNSANNIGEGTINGGVWLATSAAYHGHGVNVMPENFNRVIVNFAARRAVEPTWINAQDNFSYPNTKKNGYQTFENDCLVYSIFDTASNQAAYRNWKNYQNTNIKGKWINNWFWLKRDFVLEHAENINQAIIYDDARGDTDRFVANEIERRNFSPEAKNVLDLATNVWIEQLQYRDLAINDLPGKSLNAWDAGWYQMKLIQKNYLTRSMNKLQEAIKGLKQKIAKQVIYYEMLALDK